jgi:hypothetical protein
MKKNFAVAITLLFLTCQVNSQEKLLTKAEKSDFKSTSDYKDVMSFINSLKISSHFIKAENIGTTIEGREIPLLIIGNPLPKSPSDVKNDGRLIIYIQANIHAGEVEGKEATLMFARDLLKGKSPELLKKIVFLICPLFNPDGNEKISPLNRTYQNGPVNGVGLRYNGQSLDLNRDAMKAESPEVRSVLKGVFNKWDPAIFMDCHTTDGSFHVEPVTFTWMVNPDGDNSLIHYMRDKMIPAMSFTLKDKYKTENCYYGEFNDMMNPESGWFYDAAEPRYMSNYYGLRNRLGILDENYVYSDFKSRVMGCYYLIWSLGEYAAANKTEIKKMLQEADARIVSRGLNPAVTDSFSVEYKVRPLPDKVTIQTFEAEMATDSNGRRRYQKTDRQKTVTIPYYIDYYSTRNVRFPFAYLLVSRDPEVISLLKVHGIKMEKLAADSRIETERFDISGLKPAGRLNQGHYMNTVEGKFVSDSVSFPAGTIVIRTSQPLANLAAYLLEPQSNDGLLTWNFLDRYLVPQWGMGYNPYPVYKVLKKSNIKTIPF